MAAGARLSLLASPRWLAPLGMLLCALAGVVAIALAAPEAAHAAPSQDTDPGDGNCLLGYYNAFKVDGAIVKRGFPLRDSSLQIDATATRIAATRNGGPKVCDPLIFSISSFQWSFVEVPPGQNPTFTNQNTRSPTVNLQGPGIYRVRFTACQTQCTLTRNGKSRKVGPFVRDVTMDVGTEAAPPPESTPTPPPLNFPQPPPPQFGLGERTLKCAAGGGFTDPEWVTTQRFGGANDYRFVEGQVSWSRIADLDNFLNHPGRGGNGQDFEWKVIPDAPYEGLQQPEKKPDGWKTEWESGSLPAVFRPTPGDRYYFNTRPGDRVSAYGFWIFDCGHYPWKTELHPPVGLATQRPRPVQIPPSFRAQGFPNGFGSNIWVPGVVADIWFNRRSGGAGSCTNTGLHQPFPNEPLPLFCLSSPHPVNRKFTFNVYLPRSPLRRAQELGRTPPAPPLFVGTEKLSGGTGGAEPTFVVRESGGLTWLEVTVDGSTFSGNTYARRMSIAWAYPNPTNWGASRWRVTLKSMKAIDDAEYFSFDEGDWRFHFNTNNRDQEWTPLFSCDGCIDDDTTYPLTTRPGGPNITTGQSGGGNGSHPKRSRNLGPDLVLFPEQEVRVHSVGYDDEILGQNIGTVNQYHPQEQADYSTPSSVDKGSYKLNYTVNPVGSVGQAALTPEAAALLQAYTGKGAQCSTGTNAPTGGQVGLQAPPECSPGVAQDPFGGKPVLKLDELPAYEAQGDENSEYALTHITPARIKREFKSLKGRSRRRFLKEIKQGLQGVPQGQVVDTTEFVGRLERALPARLVRQAVPRSIRRSVKRFRKRGRADRRKRARQRRLRARRRARARRRRARRRRARKRRAAAAQTAPGGPIVRVTLAELAPLR